MAAKRHPDQIVCDNVRTAQAEFLEAERLFVFARTKRDAAVTAFDEHVGLVQSPVPDDHS